MTDEILRQEPGVTIYRAGTFGPGVPYRPVKHEDSLNHGFRDLRDHPELVSEIPEASGSPGLQAILRALNTKGAALMSLGCEMKLNPREGASDGFAWYVHSYTDLTFRDPTLSADEQQLIGLANWLADDVLASAGRVPFTYELGIQRMRSFFEAQEAYCLDIGLSGFGRTPEDAALSYESAAHLTAAALERFSHRSG